MIIAKPTEATRCGWVKTVIPHRRLSRLPDALATAKVMIAPPPARAPVTTNPTMAIKAPFPAPEEFIQNALRAMPNSAHDTHMDTRRIFQRLGSWHRSQGKRWKHDVS